MGSGGINGRGHGDKENTNPDIMKLLLSLCVLGLTAAAPAPQEEMIEAVPYIHEEIAAEPYVHNEPVETHDIAAESYVHNEIAAEPYVHQEPAPAPVVQYAAVAPVAYAGYPYTVAVAPSAPAKDVKVATYSVAAPATYSLAAPAYYLPAVKTGCINSVGSVVPCAQ